MRRKPIVWIATPYDTYFSADFRKWQEEFPEFDLRVVQPRKDGQITVPTSGFGVVALHGVRHTTTDMLRRKWGTVNIVRRHQIRGEIAKFRAKLLQSQTA